MSAAAPAGAAPTEGTSAGTDLVLRGLRKSYGSFTAVHDLDLVVPSGSFFALLGPSGCGKTTTLRMVAGLEEPTSGQIMLGGSDVSRLKPYKRPVNTVFQSYALFPHLSIAENVAFGLKRRGKKKVDAEVAAMLELVELSDLAKRRPAQLSGGQQQRVALARALINRPQVLLLDEPLGALDLKLRRQMQLELKHIQTEVGLTFVHVTHDQEEAMTMADTVAVMNKGRIEQMGAPEDLYENPATTFVANFLGQSNLVAGSVVEGGGETVTLDVQGTRLTAPRARLATDAPQVWVGVRPEKITLTRAGSPAPSAAAGNLLAGGVVTDISFVGVSTQYVVRMPWGQELSVFLQNTGAHERLVVGDAVDLHWSPDHTFCLDASQDARAGVEEDES
ncbi:ABC transporter ATP-binding protein [Nocardioides bruguierae]|uniref:ABC transporter ATP-binding protein n=1 Tax=Nocardioides bruguierae TaxID=2945102 RepID=UPI0020223A3D|nr:ABC transporter ATP-binding protein [Nocardioides bruguierae]MCL8027126.1 ABC transporter ATP-binding protein [Nocardioides bruguierae]